LDWTHAGNRSNGTCDGHHTLSESFGRPHTDAKNREHFTASLHHPNGPVVMAQHAIIIAENAFHVARPATPRSAVTAPPPFLRHRLIGLMNALLCRA
jgi:hypothetical protein